MSEKQSRGRHLATAIGAAAAGLGGTQATDAAVTYQAVNIAIPPDYGVNLNGDATNEFFIRNRVDGAEADAYIKANDYATGAGSLRDSAGGPVSNLAAGTLIGPGSGVFSSSGTDALNGVDNGIAAGNFQVSDGPGYIGVQFQIGLNTHYGYVGYESAGAENSNSGRVYALAYESVPLAAITAGAIPEPSSVALLAAGAVGVTAYRRRRTT